MSGKLKARGPAVRPSTQACGARCPLAGAGIERRLDRSSRPKRRCRRRARPADGRCRRSQPWRSDRNRAAMARGASSLPGIGKSILSGSQLESMIATTGMPRRLASWIAIASLLVSMTNIRSGVEPMSLMPPSALSSFSRSRSRFRRSFLVRPCGLAGQHLVELAQALDRVGDRLPVGQHAAEPARIDVVLGRTLRRVGDDVGRLALGADEQHAAALGDGVGHLLQRLVQQRHGLRRGR